VTGRSGRFEAGEAARPTPSPGAEKCVAALVGLLLLTSCADGVVTSFGEPSRTPPATLCTAAASTIRVEPVKGGDVNTMYVKASVTGPQGPLRDTGLSFISLKRGHKPVSHWAVPRTDSTGSTHLDVGGYVASDAKYREAFAVDDTLKVSFTGQKAAPGRPAICPSSQEVAFAPAVRAYRRAETGVANEQQLLRRLEELDAGLGLNQAPFRLPDGQSPCRILEALLADLERHRDWFNREIVDPELTSMRDGLYSCPAIPESTGLDVHQLILTLTQGN
jgi:hypothetical protein